MALIEYDELVRELADLTARVTALEIAIVAHSDVLNSHAGSIQLLNDLTSIHSSQISLLNTVVADLGDRVVALERPDRPTIPDPLNAVWIQSTSDHALARDRVRYAANLGANTVFVFCGTGRGVTFYNSVNIPTSNSLDATIAEAALHNIAVYVALPCKYFWRASHPEQDMYDEWGDHWLDFRNPGARALIATLMSDLAQYPIGGVCLDYIRWDRYRYPGSTLTSTPITQTVRACYDVLSQTSLALTASPISIYDSSIYGACESYGQCWQEWVDLNIVDWVLPMVYAQPYTAHLTVRIAEWLALNYVPGIVAPCLSPCKNGDLSQPIPLADWQAELDLIRTNGLYGFAVFDQPILATHVQHADMLSQEWSA